MPVKTSKKIDPYLFFLLKRMLEIEAIKGTGPCTTWDVKCYLYEELKPINEEFIRTTYSSRNRDKATCRKIETIRKTILVDLDDREITPYALEQVLKFIRIFGHYKLWIDFEKAFENHYRPEYLKGRDYTKLTARQKIDLKVYVYNRVDEMYNRALLNLNPLIIDVLGKMVVRQASIEDLVVIEMLENRHRNAYESRYQELGRTMPSFGYRRSLFEKKPFLFYVSEVDKQVISAVTLVPVSWHTYSNITEGRVFEFELTSDDIYYTEAGECEVLLMMLAFNKPSQMLTPFLGSFIKIISQIIPINKITPDTILCLPQIGLGHAIAKVYDFDHTQTKAKFMQKPLLSFLVRFEKMKEIMSFWKEFKR
ncbi:hypothetical protein CAP35_12480 [Chitinophagaceae bacterium IBVUCB1]|nr:hypothetical protein CAP35_12480 [Chitinophagaceae bacterium IBVUCB1]